MSKNPEICDFQMKKLSFRLKNENFEISRNLAQLKTILYE